MNLRERASALKRDIPAVYLALQRKDTPVIAKVMAGVTVCYALSPIDFIPDFVPILGYTDDVILLPFLIAVTVKLIPKEIMQECQKKSEEMWKEGKPKRWYYAIPIVCIWVIALLFVVFKCTKFDFQ